MKVYDPAHPERNTPESFISAGKAASAEEADNEMSEAMLEARAEVEAGKAQSAEKAEAEAGRSSSAAEAGKE